MKVRIWGEGGFDPAKPNNNLVEEYELPDREPTQQELDRQSGMSKLAELGLTPNEIKALIG